MQIDVPDDDLRESLIAVVDQVLIDPRGWPAAGAVVEIVDESIYRIGVVSCDDMDRACRPFGVASKFACQPGPVRMVNDGLWADPPDWWPGDADGYRRHAVNHELGHMHGLRSHPPSPGPGEPLPVMALPPRGGSTECVGGEWPTPAELEALRRIAQG